jgi:hypothetical protein
MIDLVASEVLFGTAKKMNAELEKMPLHAAATVVSMMNSALQHRQISEQLLLEEKKGAIAERQLQLAENERKRQAAAAEARFASQVKQPTVDHAPPIAINPPAGQP